MVAAELFSINNIFSNCTAHLGTSTSLDNFPSIGLPQNVLSLPSFLLSPHHYAQS